MAEDEAKKSAEEAAKKATSAEAHDDQTASSSSKDDAAVNEQDTALQSAQQQVETLQQQLEAMSDKYLRAEAEIKNIQTRHKKDQAALVKYDGQQLAHDVLPVLDNLERALQTEVTDDQALSLKKGVELVQKHLMEALTSNGVTEIKAEGQPFDPQIHQAVQSVPAESDDQKDHVTAVLQKGYQLKDRVLRPAMVVVAQ
ncbi:nucleotide exchange factor GrpE [Secundilactobacillus kimchicus]|uniref:Protein GrpE n=1 Tax=Secundilactobacillus kimchicus JCM 15530 TaxID=1302272 RepID=A0A0R1HVA5_9LACO|nr:nucleotide exchange factor GrpE [Secundilactobacillus kimchicus]KRK49433.1 co-chaperone GrpE [Secundilactobacillus kimchicus JCM 15530]MBT9672979.1 nucleotide exchange factor GrpE [Secundilactobacillus kimchicus]